MPPSLSQWGHHDLKVLYVLLHDRVEWPLLTDEELQIVPKDERSGQQWRRAKLQELLPGRTWWAILSKLYRMGVTHERLQTILGPHYNAVECEAPTYKDKPKQSAKTWKPWTPEQAEALKTALLCMDDMEHRTDKGEVYKRQTLLRESVPRRTWEAVYQKVVRESPTGLGMKNVLHRKLGTKCRGDAKKALANPYKMLRREVRDKLHEARTRMTQEEARGCETCARAEWCARGASPEVLACCSDGGQGAGCARGASPEVLACCSDGSQGAGCARGASPEVLACCSDGAGCGQEAEAETFVRAVWCSSEAEACEQAAEPEVWSVLK
jgi:hypothetical protein